MYTIYYFRRFLFFLKNAHPQVEDQTGVAEFLFKCIAIPENFFNFPNTKPESKNQ